MGIQWLKEITEILKAAGIRAGEAYPAGRQMELSAPAAAVGLRDLDYREGTAEFEIRMLSPGGLGGWQCQNAAADAVAALENAGVRCRMEPMAYRAGQDCFEMLVIGTRVLSEPEGEGPGFSGLDLLVEGAPVGYVTEFTAEQDRKRWLIGTLNQAEPVGVTPAAGGWSIRMVQEIPAGVTPEAEPEEPFTVTVRETGIITVFTGCCWNRVKKTVGETGIRAEWEGFALTREEMRDGEDEV